MDRIKRIFRLIHLSVWSLFILLVGLQLKSDGGRWLGATLGFISTCLFVFYGHFYLLSRYAGRKRERTYFLRLAAIVLTGPLLVTFLYRGNLDLAYYGIHLFFTTPVFLFLSWLARTTENLVINTVKKEQLEKQAVEAELYYLKSQLAPHFLFNTLNNIHTLVYMQAPAAPDAVMQLASLMRYMIYESNAPTVPLTRELAYLQDYISLQQLRYRQAPVVDFRIDGNPEACDVAPLLFIHLLENAYKHSPAKLAPGELKVAIEVADDMLTFSVQNPVAKIPAHDLDGPGGIGLPNVRKRLALLYPDSHSLEIQRSDEVFTVVLKISGLQLLPHERQAQLFHH